LLDTVKTANLTILLKVVEAIQAVYNTDSTDVQSYDYSKLCVYHLFKREPFMTAPWYAEQWLVCLSVCLAYSVRKFPFMPDFL
jgi:hypothetical protein